jgi:hypothetical protein
VKLLVVLSLLWPLLVVARLLWHQRRPRAARSTAFSAGVMSPQLARFALSPDLVIDALPPLDARSLLVDLRSAPPPAIDVSLLGVVDDQSEATHALWRASQRALASRRA